MYEIGDKVDVYQAHPRGRKTAFLFTGIVEDINNKGLHYVIPIGMSHDKGRWVPDWALTMIHSAATIQEDKIKAYERAMRIL